MRRNVTRPWPTSVWFRQFPTLVTWRGSPVRTRLRDRVVCIAATQTEAEHEASVRRSAAALLEGFPSVAGDDRPVAATTTRRPDLARASAVTARRTTVPPRRRECDGQELLAPERGRSGWPGQDL